MLRGNRCRALLAVLALLACPTSALAAPGDRVDVGPGEGTGGSEPVSVRVERDIVFRTTTDGVELKLDRWHPATQKPGTLLPVRVLVHGGGWRTGDKREWEQADWPKALAARGAIVYNVNYRLACPAADERFKPESAELCGYGMVEARYDVLEALRWVAAHTAADGGNRSRISMVGGSAGAQLAMLVASERASPDVKSVVAISPPAHLPWFARVPVPRLQDAIVNTIGCRWGVCPGTWRRFSPSQHVNRGVTPPTYVFVAGADPATPLAQARTYHHLLTRAGIQTTWRTTSYRTERCHGTRLCMNARLAGTPKKLRADVYDFLARWG